MKKFRSLEWVWGLLGPIALIATLLISTKDRKEPPEIVQVLMSQGGTCDEKSKKCLYRTGITPIEGAFGNPDNTGIQIVPSTYAMELTTLPNRPPEVDLQITRNAKDGGIYVTAITDFGGNGRVDIIQIFYAKSVPNTKGVLTSDLVPVGCWSRRTPAPCIMPIDAGQVIAWSGWYREAIQRTIRDFEGVPLDPSKSDPF